MINSINIYKNEELDIYYILINTKDKWIDYQINWKSPELGKLYITFYFNVDMPGVCEVEDDWSTEINVEKGFDYSHYLITSKQNKDQIMIICIPNSLFFLSNKFFKKL